MNRKQKKRLNKLIRKTIKCSNSKIQLQLMKTTAGAAERFGAHKTAESYQRLIDILEPPTPESGTEESAG